MKKRLGDFQDGLVRTARDDAAHPLDAHASRRASKLATRLSHANHRPRLGKQVPVRRASSRTARVAGYIRQLGCRKLIPVTFPMANSSVRVYNENRLSQAWGNKCICCLCHATSIPCICMRLYRVDFCCQESHAETHMLSTFRINYTALQVFEAIRPQLCLHSGYGAGEDIIRTLRNLEKV